MHPVMEMMQAENTKAKSENTNRNYGSVCHLCISDNISHRNEAMHEKAGRKKQS